MILKNTNIYSKFIFMPKGVGYIIQDIDVTSPLGHVTQGRATLNTEVLIKWSGTYGILVES